MERQDELNELHDAPILRSIAKEDPFVVPDSFFDRFPAMVQQRIQAQASTRTSDVWSRWTSALLPRIAVGSLAAMAVITLAWTLWPAENATMPPPYAAVEPEEILGTDVDDELIYATLLEEHDLMQPVDLPTDDAEVLAYLENENLPLDLLIEEL